MKMFPSRERSGGRNEVVIAAFFILVSLFQLQDSAATKVGSLLCVRSFRYQSLVSSLLSLVLLQRKISRLRAAGFPGLSVTPTDRQVPVPPSLPSPIARRMST